MRFSHRILALPLLATLVFALVFVLAFANLHESTQLLRRVQSELLAAVELSHGLEKDAMRLRHDLDAAITVRDLDEVADTEIIADRFRANLRQGLEIPIIDRDHLATLATAFERYDSLARRVALVLIDASGIPDERMLDDAAAMNAAYENLQQQLNELTEAQAASMGSALADTGRRFRNRMRAMTTVAAAVLVGLIVMAIGAVVSIVRPLRSLREAAGAIARGQLDTEFDVEYHSDDDLGQLAVSFREMRAALEADIAHREEVQFALEESEQRLALALDAANDGIWDLNTADGSFYCSDRFAAILGYTPEEKPTTHQAMDAMMEGVPRDELERLFTEERSASQEVSIEARMRRKDGGLTWVQIKGRTVEREPDGRPLRMVGTISDISQRKAAEEELRWAQDRLMQAEKLASLGRLVAGLAHEINSPLGALVSDSDLTVRSARVLRERLELGDDRPSTGDERAAKAIAALERSAAGSARAAARLEELLGGLKRFAALDRAERQEADINDLLDATVTAMSDEFSPGVEVVREYGELPAIPCFPGQLNQLFLALLRNGVDAMSGQGTLRLTTAVVDDQQIEIAVADDGRGIADHELPGLFEPRFRAGDDRVRLGWGLVTAARIVEEHGGRIQVSSRLGEGSTFTVTLPLRPGVA